MKAVVVLSLATNALALVARSGPLTVTCSSRWPQRCRHAPILLKKVPLPNGDWVEVDDVEAETLRECNGGVSERSAPDIFFGGLKNLVNEPFGWFFGQPSPLYSNALTQRGTQPSVSERAQRLLLEEKWRARPITEKWLSSTYSEESRQFRRTGTCLAEPRSAQPRPVF